LPQSTNRQTYNGQIKYNSPVSFDINKYSQKEWDMFYELNRAGRYQEADSLLSQIQKDQSMGNWAVKWVPESNASFTREWFPTKRGNLASDFVLKLGSPRPVLEVQAIIHVQQYGHHKLFGFMERPTFHAHWGLKTDETTYMYGVNLGQIGVIYSTEEEP